MDGDEVVLKGFIDGHIPPQHENKPELLAKVLFASKAMNKDKKDLRDIALLISSSINAIHAYADGNGRTSRSIYLLFAENFNEETKRKIQEALFEDGREKIDINPEFISFELEKLLLKEIFKECPSLERKIYRLFYSYFTAPKDFKFNQEISEKDKRIFLKALHDDDLFIVSVNKFVLNNPDIEKKKYLNRFKNRTTILIDILAKDLNSEKMNQLLEIYKNLKIKQVEKLIDCIANPDKEEYRIEQGEQKITLKNYFENRIKEKQEDVLFKK